MANWMKDAVFSNRCYSRTSHESPWPRARLLHGPKAVCDGLFTMRHFLDLVDLSSDEITHLLRETARLKTASAGGDRTPVLQGRVLGLVFEKPSLRTRASFQSAMAQLGGSSVFMTGTEAGLGSRESVPDFARVMSQYVDAIVLRTYSHSTVEEFAAYASCPVVNGLSD